MQKEKEKQMKNTDEEGDASMADADDKGPETDKKQEEEEEEEILEDVGGIQFEVLSLSLSEDDDWWATWSQYQYMIYVLFVGLSQIQWPSASLNRDRQAIST